MALAQPTSAIDHDGSSNAVRGYQQADTDPLACFLSVQKEGPGLCGAP